MLFAVSTLAAQNIEQKIVGCDTLTYQYTPIDHNYSKTSSSGRLAYKLFAGDPWAIMLLPIYTLETNFGIAFTAKYYKPKFEISPTAIASISGYYNISVSGKNKLYHARNSLLVLSPFLLFIVVEIASILCFLLAASLIS